MKKINQRLLAILLFFSSTAFAATLQTDGNGILTGAVGINISGEFYDVVFMDGSCNSLFSGCNYSHFTFQNNYAAMAAAEALQSQVFLGIFNDDPTKTRGCELTPASCAITTPHYVIESTTSIFVERFINMGLNSVDADFIGGASMTFDEDTSSAINTTFAVWSPSAVPLPSAVWLFSSGLIGLVGARHKSKNA